VLAESFTAEQFSWAASCCWDADNGGDGARDPTAPAPLDEDPLDEAPTPATEEEEDMEEDALTLTRRFKEEGCKEWLLLLMMLLAKMA